MRHAGLDPASSAFLDSRLRGNDILNIFNCRSNNLAYEFSVWEGFDLKSKVYREHKKWEGFYQIFPKDSLIVTPLGPTILAEPLFYRWTGNGKKTGFETQAIYDINDANTLVVGCMYEKEKTPEINYDGNYTPTDNPSVVIPLSSFQDWPDEFNWDDRLLKEISRQFFSKMFGMF